MDTEFEPEWSVLIEFDSEMNLLVLSLLDFEALIERLVSVLIDREPAALMLLDCDVCFESLSEPDRLAESLTCLFDSEFDRLADWLALVALEFEKLPETEPLSDALRDCSVLCEAEMLVD